MKKELTNKKPVVISAWICCGKTYLTKKYDNITELASGDWKYILTDEQRAVANKESLKSTARELNPAWPQNYYDAILAEVARKKYDIIFIAPCFNFNEMREYGVENIILAYPDPACKEEYKQRARNRGANDAFVSRVEAKISTDFAEFLMFPNEKIIIQPGEYLEDALVRVGILKNRKS